MSNVPRELQIIYGGFTVGGNTDRRLDGYQQITREYERSSIEFEFTVEGSSAAEFADACRLAEASFRKPYRDLVVTQSSQTLLSLKQSTNTGFDAEPEIRKVGDEATDCGRLRRYRVSISFGMPADASGMNGRRESTVEVSWGETRVQTVTVSGTWTAIGSTDARAQYRAQIAAFGTSVLAGLSITNYEIVSETEEEDTNDNLLVFTRVFRELIFSQGGADLDDSAIVNQSFIIRRQEVAPGDTPTTGRLIELEGRYSASIDKTVTTDLVAKWAAIKSWVISNVRTILAGSGQMGIVEITPEYDFDANRIDVTIRAEGSGGSVLIESRITVEDDYDLGLKFDPVWSGNPFRQYKYQGPAELIRRINWTYVQSGKVDLRQAEIDGKDKAGGFYQTPYTAPNTSAGKWIETNRRTGATHLQRGIGSDTLDVTEVTTTITLRRVDEAKGGGAVTPAGGGPLPADTPAPTPMGARTP